jgi:hypothetical protein
MAMQTATNITIKSCGAQLKDYRSLSSLLSIVTIFTSVDNCGHPDQKSRNVK